MIYHVVLINAKMAILSPEIFIIPAIEETQILQRAAFHGLLCRFNSLRPWRDPWPPRVRQFALYLFPISIRRSTTWILCVLDVGLAGCVCLLSQSPAFLPANSIHPHLILISFRFLSGVPWRSSSVHIYTWTVSGLLWITSQSFDFISFQWINCYIVLGTGSLAENNWSVL